MMYVPAWLPEMRMWLSSINSPDTTVAPAEHLEKYCALLLNKYAPMTNDREPPYELPVAFDTATLLVIVTSDTFTVQPLQYVSSDWAVDVLEKLNDHE
jgi:hypothetical protein